MTTSMTVLIIVAINVAIIGLLVRLVGACFSSELRRRIKARPVTHAVWCFLVLAFYLLVVATGPCRRSLGFGSRHPMIAATVASLQAVQAGLRAYQVDCGSYPSESQGLMALIRDAGVPKWKGPYVRGSIPADAWGTPFLYSFRDNHVILRSAGPDRKLGTADDIERSW